jgi:hypothetical protein
MRFTTYLSSIGGALILSVLTNDKFSRMGCMFKTSKYNSSASSSSFGSGISMLSEVISLKTKDVC